MLKAIRIILAVASIVLVTLLFIDFTGTAAQLWPWMAKIQFIPALLSVNLVALAVIVVGTLLLGRVYCSVICPLGISQDVVNWLRSHLGKKKGRKNRFNWKPESRRLRLIVLTVFCVFLILGLTDLLAASIAGLIEPYSAYGRIASQIIAPIYDGANNLLASWAEANNSYAFYKVATAVSIPLLAIAIITLVVIVAMSWRGGRDYCNTICPVGTILGYLSKFSLLRPVINPGKCINCSKCARNCKAKCINAKAHAIDYSRCVACMDCISTCREGAITYTWRRYNETKPSANATNTNRRAFMATSAFVAASIASEAIAKKTDGGLTPLKDKARAQRNTPVVPAGAQSLSHLSRHCTACQLCIQSCPEHVLKPSTDLESLMQPRLDFTNGYCHIECNKCSDICPAGAFHPFAPEDKAAIKVGTATVDLDACISASKGEDCGNCASRCPAQAISMVAVNSESGKLMPVVNDEICIGCGACEYNCPVGNIKSIDNPGSAIHVEGIRVHRYV